MFFSLFFKVTVSQIFTIKLSGSSGRGRVEGDDLDSHQVLAGGDALGHVEIVPAAVGDEGVDCPDAVVETGVGDLEPFLACA